MGNSESDFVPYIPARGVFVRFENGCTTVQLRGFLAFAFIAPTVQYWVSLATKYTSASLDELAAAWVTAAREIVSKVPPSFEVPRDAKSQEQLAMRGELVQPEHILSEAIIREALKISRECFEQTEAPQESPVRLSAFGASLYGQSITPQDALHFIRLAVYLMQARGQFEAEHHVAGAELAGLAAADFKRFDEWEHGPILEAGKIYLEAKRKEREAKEPARMATEIRNATICKTARERRDAGKSRVSTVEFLMNEHKLKQRSIDEILKAGGVYWDKTP